MRNNNWDVSPGWVRFQNEYCNHSVYTGWDVCPHWVRFKPRKTVQGSDCSNKCREGRQKHTHEFLGSTKLAGRGRIQIHNHRFAGISGEAIPSKNSHTHKICTKTDYYNHLHGIEICSGPAIDIGNGKHIHLAKGKTTFNDGHDHDYQFATLIESPLLPPGS